MFQKVSMLFCRVTLGWIVLAGIGSTAGCQRKPAVPVETPTNPPAATVTQPVPLVEELAAAQEAFEAEDYPVPPTGRRGPRTQQPHLTDTNVITGAVINESNIVSVIHVSAQRGIGAGDGSAERPFKSIQPALTSALKQLAAGKPTKVRIGEGVYRENLGELHFDAGQARDTLLVIEGVAAGRVVISGSDVFVPGEWQSLGNGLYVHTWEHDFGFVTDAWYSSSNVISKRAELVFVNGRTLHPEALETYDLKGFWTVDSPPGTKRTAVEATYNGYRDPAGTLKDWTFGVTERPEHGRKLYVKLPPNVGFSTAKVEVSTRESLLQLGSKDNLILRNLTFTHTANRAHLESDVIKWRGEFSNVVIDSCRFVWNSAFGLSLNNVKNLTVRDSTFNFNGYGGAGIGTISNAVWVGCESSFNDWRNLLCGNIYNVHCTAGIKVHTTTDMLVKDHLAAGNFVNGLWFDVFCRNIVVEDSQFVFNAREGLFFELSPGPCRASHNLMAWNGYSSYTIDIVGDTLAEFNIIHNGIHPWLGNRGYAVASVGTGWRNSEHAKMFGDNAHFTGNSHTFRTNIFSGAAAFTLLSWRNGVRADQQDVPAQKARRMFKDAYAADGNLYWGQDSRRFKYEDAFVGTNMDLSFDEWRAYQGSNEVDAVWADPRFVAPEKLDFTLQPDSPRKGWESIYPAKRLPDDLMKTTESYFKWAGWM